MPFRSLPAVAFALILLPGTSHAIDLFYAELNGANVIPPNASPATGDAVLTYDPIAHTLRVQYEFSGLTGTSTGAHLHCCQEPPMNSLVAVFFAGFPIGVTAGSYDQTLDLTSAGTWNAAFLTTWGGGTTSGAEAALSPLMRMGWAYVCVHTTDFPGSEIRDHLISVVFRDGFESGLTDAWSFTNP